MEHKSLGRYRGKFPEPTEHLKRQSFFSSGDVPNGFACSICDIAYLMKVSGFRDHFSVNGTD